MARMQEYAPNRWSQPGRKVGRPRQRWEDCLDQYFRKGFVDEEQGAWRCYAFDRRKLGEEEEIYVLKGC